MFVPTSVLNNGDFSKASAQVTGKRVFKDKIVDSRRAPYLFNIENGNQEMDAVTSAISPMFKMSMDPASADRGNVARQMLLKTNVSYTLENKKFSLLRAQSNKGDLKNKNMTDQKQYDETFNNTTTAEDKFTSTQDPFYKADEDQGSNQVYEQEVNQYDQIAIPPDLSRLASEMAVLNLSATFKKKTKYFIRHSTGVNQ